MKRIIILIPVFNDWPSLKRLIHEISLQINIINNYKFSMIIINDGSTTTQPEIKKPQNLEFIKILNMIENRGHAECIAYGINYINENEKFDNLLLMDGDGEDRPEEINKLLEKVSLNNSISVVAKRVKRSEGLIFRLLYQFHKMITFIFTGRKINFGNFSCLSKNDIMKICNNTTLWSSYSGTLKKYIKNYSEIDSIRGLRFFGPSKMSIFKLMYHSFSIIEVFKYQVLLRSLLLTIVLIYSSKYLGAFLIYFSILTILFCLIIFIVSALNKRAYFRSKKNNLRNISNITH